MFTYNTHCMFLKGSKVNYQVCSVKSVVNGPFETDEEMGIVEP